MPGRGGSPTRMHGVVWASSSLLLVFGISVGLVGPAVPSLQEAYALSYTGAALHLTVFAVGSGFGSAMDARFARRLSRASALRVALAGVAAGAALTGVAPSFAASLTGVTVMGFCGTVAMNIAHGMVGSQQRERRGTALATAHLFAAAGLVVAASAVAGSRALGQWRLAFAAPVAVAMLLLLVVDLPGGLPVRPREPAGSPSGGQAVPSAVRVGGVVLALAVAVEWAVTFWAATFLRDPVGLTPGTADVATIGVLGAVVAGRVILTRLTRRHAAARLLRGGLALTIVASVPYLTGAYLRPPFGTIVALAALAVLCLTVTTLFPLALAVTLGAAGPSDTEQQRASATALGIGAAGAVVTPYVLGAVADAATLTVALTVLPIGSVLALLGTAVLLRLDAQPQGASHAVRASPAPLHTTRRPPLD